MLSSVLSSVLSPIAHCLVQCLNSSIFFPQSHDDFYLYVLICLLKLGFILSIRFFINRRKKLNAVYRHDIYIQKLSLVTYKVYIIRDFLGKLIFSGFYSMNTNGKCWGILLLAVGCMAIVCNNYLVLYIITKFVLIFF